MPITTGIISGKVPGGNEVRRPACAFIKSEAFEERAWNTERRDAFNHIRYFLRFTVRKRVSGKKNIYFKVNSAKFIWKCSAK